MVATMRQVAAAAGVSIATASRALSGSGAVVAATRQRVLEVAAELDYTPSRLARGLVTGSTGNVGVIVPDVTNPFFAPFLAELEAALGEHDVGLLMGNSQESREHEYRLVRRMSTQVDGLVLASSRLSDEQILHATGQLPVVLANRRIAGTPSPDDRLRQVVIDVRPGFRAAVDHLHALGHRELTYVDGPSQSWSSAQKRTALEDACAALGVALTTMRCERPDFSAGRGVAGRILGEGATAVLAYNDQVALGLLSACRDAGVDVPAQLSVVGCDDALPEGMASPALTTIDCSSRTLGVLAAAAIVQPAEREPAAVPSHLVIRSSTGRAASQPHLPHPSPTEELA